MPYFTVKTNVAVAAADRTALVKKMSAVAADVTGKPEAYIIAHLIDSQTMTFGGSTEPCAMCDMRSLGFKTEACKAASAKICTFLKNELKISGERVYIEFGAPAPAMFGHNSGTF